MMTRRAFLSALSALPISFALDPELALWKPGARTIFLPSNVRYHRGIKDATGLLKVGPQITRTEYLRLKGQTHLWTLEPMFTTLDTGYYRNEITHAADVRVLGQWISTARV